MHSISINNTTITIPTTLDEFTLGQRIDFHNQYGRQLEEMQASIDSMEDEVEREFELIQFRMEFAFSVFAFFTQIDVEVIRESEFEPDIIAIYSEHLSSLFEEIQDAPVIDVASWLDDLWFFPPVILKNGFVLKTGEYLDAKQMLLNVRNSGGSRWDALHALCTIFFIKAGESYSESFLHEGSDRLQLMLKLPLSLAYQVEANFNKLSDFIDSHFGIFQPSRVKSAGKWSKKHYEQYGWVNFLKDIAKTKAFDIDGSGLNSIDCVRKTPLFDVLVWASEEKGMSEARYLDQEAEWENLKNRR